MTGSLRVLMAEDSATDAKLIVQELRRSWQPVEFERVETAETMRAALERQTWDLVISDWSMPKFSAEQALGVLKETDLDLPFIIVSGTIGEETAVEAMRAGAHDYVLKDKLGRLTPAIERELREFRERAARRVAEAALRESEKRFRTLSDSGIIGITIADVLGNILETNDASLEMFGYTREEILGGSVRWADMTPPEFAHLTVRSVEQLRASGVAQPFEMEAVRKDGRRIPILIGAAMLDYPKCITFTADLTERRQAETGRLRAEIALRQSEEQLRQAQKMDAIGRLAGGVAHDFNNILSVIMTYTELILADLNAADPMRVDVAEVHKAALRAAGLTRQLLMFSRQEVIQPKVLDLTGVLSGMDKMLRRILGEDVELVSLAQKATGRVKVDPSHLEQVILNLIVNARDAMPTGGKLTIETANVVLDETYVHEHLPAKAGPYVMLAVSDTGTGMDRETQKRIFEPFFTTKGIGKGTGLGLSMVFGIVQQSGGTIWIYSEPDLGTTFKIYLPRVDAEVESLRAPGTQSALKGTETVLLVEDEEQVRAVAVSILRRQGYRVIAARHAGEALLLCEEHPEPIHLLLTDVVMPQMSGPALAKRLAHTQPEMKVLCMSGYADDSIVRHGVLEGGVAFLQKPFTPLSMAAKIREVLDRDPLALEAMAATT